MTDRTVPNGLRLARNIIAAAGAVLLLLGLVTLETSGRLFLWLAVAALVVATGLALATTRWRSLPTGTKAVIVIAVGGILLIVVDLLVS